MGLGLKTNIDLPYENGGIIPTPSWKKKHFNERWQGGDTINTVIGQGFVQTTPLQLAILAVRIATGKKLHPIILSPTHNKIQDKVNIDQEHLNLVRHAMNELFNHKSGTGYRQRIASSKGEIAGKTGNYN